MTLGGFVPQGPVSQQTSYELRVQCVPGFMRHRARFERTTNQRQISDKIQRLMAAKFIRKTQRAVQYAIVVEYDGVLHRAATNQSHRLHSLKILHEAKCARRSQFAAERFAI